MEDIDIIPPDDAEEVSPKFVLFYALEKKKSIIAEACTVDNSIKSITWKWWVQPNQICKWMRSYLSIRNMYHIRAYYKEKCLD